MGAPEEIYKTRGVPFSDPISNHRSINDKKKKVSSNLVKHRQTPSNPVKPRQTFVKSRARAFKKEKEEKEEEGGKEERRKNREIRVAMSRHRALRVIGRAECPGSGVISADVGRPILEQPGEGIKRPR